jgi:hypothetical protein
MKFTKKELEFMYDTINQNCHPIFDKGTKKQKLTQSTLTKLENIYNK